jgi:nucleoid-associated protein YgaU
VSRPPSSEDAPAPVGNRAVERARARVGSREGPAHAAGNRSSSRASSGGRRERSAAHDRVSEHDRASGKHGELAMHTGDEATNSRTSPSTETDPSATYRVRPGDSLWRIAGRRLGPDATATATAREVTRLWERNRQRIGTGNPDLIFPGQTLRM